MTDQPPDCAFWVCETPQQHRANCPLGPERCPSWVELTDADLPYHLQMDAPPLAECNRCHRQTWSDYEVGTEDRMTQPDGNPCGGKLVKVARR